MTNENPAVFGEGGLALTNAGEALKNSGDIHQVASDFHYAACALEPVDLGRCFLLAGDLLGEDGDVSKAAAALRAAALDMTGYGELLCREEDGEDSAGGQLKQGAGHLRAAAAAIRRIHREQP